MIKLDACPKCSLKHGLPNKEGGFTYVEVAITLAVMALALIGALYGTTQIQRASENAFERAVAVQHINQVMERMRDLAGTNVSLIPTTFPSGAISSSHFTSASTEILQNETMSVSYVNTSSRLLDTTITNSWQSRGGQTVSISVRTLFAKR